MSWHQFHWFYLHHYQREVAPPKKQQCFLRLEEWDWPAQLLLAGRCYIYSLNFILIRVMAPISVWSAVTLTRTLWKCPHSCLLRPREWVLYVQLLLAGLHYTNSSKFHSHLGHGTNAPRPNLTTLRGIWTSSNSIRGRLANKNSKTKALNVSRGQLSEVYLCSSN